MARKPLKKPRRNYEVGKGRPPVATRWKPGQSGNPKGRPKGSTSIDAAFDAVLRQKIPIKERGRIRYMYPFEIMAQQFATQAMKGDIKAFTLFLNRTFALTHNDSSKKIDTKGMTAQELAKLYSEMIKKPY